MNRDIIRLMTDEDILEGMRIRLEREGFKSKTVEDLIGGAQKILDACTRKQLCDAVFAENPEKAIRPFLDKLFPYMSFNKIGWYGVAMRIMGGCLRMIASNELTEEDKLRIKALDQEEKAGTTGSNEAKEPNEELEKTVYYEPVNKKTIAAKKAARKLSLPFPKAEDAIEVYESMKNDPEIQKRNSAIKAVMEKAGYENTVFDSVLMKVGIIVSVCGPAGVDKEKIAEQIISCNIDKYIKNGSPEAVSILSENLTDKRQRDFYMFAVRYCVAHEPEKFPNFNAATVRAMKYCRDNFGFYNFSNDELYSYSKYKKLLAIYKKKYRLDKFSICEISRILTVAGKLLAGR